MGMSSIRGRFFSPTTNMAWLTTALMTLPIKNSVVSNSNDTMSKNKEVCLVVLRIKLYKCKWVSVGECEEESNFSPIFNVVAVFVFYKLDIYFSHETLVSRYCFLYSVFWNLDSYNSWKIKKHTHLHLIIYLPTVSGRMTYILTCIRIWYCDQLFSL